MLERLKRCKNIDELVLTIPDKQSDDQLAELAKNWNVKISRGPENDLIKRYWLASSENNADLVVRIPGDNPVPEPSEVDKIINFHLKNNIDGFSSNLAEINNSGYPDGIGAEVFDYKYLDLFIKKKLSEHEKEHIHLNFFNYQTKKIKNKKVPVKTINCPNEFARPDLILDFNTYQQYLFMKSLYEYLYPKNKEFGILDIISWFENIYKNKYSINL